MSSEQQENLVEIGNGFWLIRTQAGFKKLMDKYLYDEFIGRKSDYEIKSWPTTYPCVATVWQNVEFGLIGVKHIHVNQMLEVIKDA